MPWPFRPEFPLVFLLVAGLAAACAAQDGRVSSTAILGTARSATAVRLKDVELRAHGERGAGLPLLDAVSVRTETDRFEASRQGYTARFNLNGFGEMRASRRVQEAGRRLAEREKSVSLHETLLARYLVLLEADRLTRALPLRQSLLAIQDDRLLVLRKQAAATGAADLPDLVEAESDRDETAAEIAALEGDLAVLRGQIGRLLGAAALPDTGGTVSLAQIRALAAGPAMPHPESAEVAARVALAASEYQLEKAEARRMLDFFQVTYGDRIEDPLSEDLSIGAGFTLPFRGDARPRLAELKLRQLAEQHELETLEASRAEEVALLASQLDALFQQYDRIARQFQDSQARHTLERAGRDALLLLEAQESLVKRRLRLADLEYGIREHYVLWLERSGRMSAEPLVNWWSEAREEF